MIDDPARPRPASPTATPHAATHHRLLRVLVFVVGVSTLGAEIAAARLMAPYFGASTIVWANTIGTVLVALSIGYWLGGRLADRRPHMEGSRAGCSAPACCWRSSRSSRAVPHALGQGLRPIDVGAFIGSLVGVLALVAVPVLLLGAVSPWAIRLSVARVDDAGRTAGGLYALSTVGSLLGTWAAALLLIPLIGTQRTFISMALMVALVAALALPRRMLLVPLGIALLLASRPARPSRARRRARARGARDGPAVRARGRGARRRAAAGAQRGGRLPLDVRRDTCSPATTGTGGSHAARRARAAPPRSVAILGNGAGTAVRAYEQLFPATQIDGVEIDGALTELGKRWFGLRERPGVRLHTDDARPYLRRAHRRWEAVFIDAYRQPYIPFYLATREFFALVPRPPGPRWRRGDQRRPPRGLRPARAGCSRGPADGLRARRARPITRENTLLIASDVAPSSARVEAALPSAPPLVRPVLARTAADLAPGLAGGPVYTDDKAPVEWLIDRSIITYAADH
jgi:hypothetical protein